MRKRDGDEARPLAAWHGQYAVRTAPQPAELTFVEGRGVRVRDAAGRWYLDARSALWNLAFGYDHPRLIEAITKQLHTLPYAPVIRFDRLTDVALRYADALVRRLPEPLRYVRFGCTGSQMTGAAALLSRAVHRAEGSLDRVHVIALSDGYHGTGAGAGALTDLPPFHDQAGPLMPDVHRVEAPTCHRCPFALTRPGCAIRCLDAVRTRVTELGPERVAAVILEPILGTGVAVPPPEYLPALGDDLRRAGIHLIFDEVTTGFGRVGAYTRAEQIGVVPDMMVLGKHLSGGYMPLSALAVHHRLHDALLGADGCADFVHGSTSDGHPLAMAAGLATLRALEDDGVLANARERGKQLEHGLSQLEDRHPGVIDVRGVGMMWGVELGYSNGQPWKPGLTARLRVRLEDFGLLVGDTGNCLNVFPPLTLTETECDELVTSLSRGLRAFGA